MNLPVLHSVSFALLALLLSPPVSHASPPLAGSVPFCQPLDLEQLDRDHARAPADLPLVFNVSDIGEVEESIVQEPDPPEQPKEVGEPRTVRLFYFLPNDRTYRAEVVEAMKTGIVEVQSFYAEQMEAHGYGNKTFPIETDDQGDPIVHRVDGDYPESNYIRINYFTQGEINRAYDNSANVILIVMDASNSSTIQGHAIYRGKERGEVTLYEEWDWSTAVHELGHGFGLQHDFRSNAYIMSYGWSDRETVQLSACAAEFLAVNPYFDSDIPLENESPPTVELISSETYPFGSVSVPVQLRVRDDDGLHQVIFLSQPRDPLHPPTPAVRECRGLAGETDTVVEFNFAWRFDAAVSQRSVYVVAVDANGNSKEVPFILESEPPPELPPGTVITPVCDRTRQVRDAIVDNISGISDCAQVAETHLVAISGLNLPGRNITALKAGDFDGLISLRSISLFNNQLSSLPVGLLDGLTALEYLSLFNNQLTGLPEGLFDGLTGLTTLYLQGNTVDPLPLTVSLEKVGTDQFKAVAPIGAPFEMVLPLTVTNGSISGGATTIAIPVGNLESQPLTVTPTPSTTAAVTVDIGTLPGLPSNHQGYALVKSANLPVEIFSSGGPGTTVAQTDFNGDGKTDFVDFFQFVDAFGSTDARFDLNGDGRVDFVDFFAFVDAFGSSGQAKLVALAREMLGLPGGPELQQNAPNPFNTETVISWFLLEPGLARLEVFALTGQRLAVLHQGPLQAGYHRLHWDGRDDAGRPLASGVYLYRLTTVEGDLTRKLTLLR